MKELLIQYIARAFQWAPCQPAGGPLFASIELDDHLADGWWEGDVDFKVSLDLLILGVHGVVHVSKTDCI